MVTTVFFDFPHCLDSIESILICINELNTVNHGSLKCKNDIQCAILSYHNSEALLYFSI
jgi:hypothetical protein